MIAEERAKGLDLAGARAVLGRVRQTLDAHPDARLDIEWRIVKGGGD